MRNIIVAFFIILLTLPSAFAEPELKGSPYELSEYLADTYNYVTLTGESELKVQADRAIVSIRVATEDSSLHNALKSNQDLRTKIFDTLKKSGISADRISASRFSSTPQHRFFGGKSYKVENLVKITIKGEEEFQEVSKIVDSYREVDYGGIEFERSDKDELKRKSIERACDAVIKKKEIYESKFNVKLVPKRFVEGPVVGGWERGMYGGGMANISQDISGLQKAGYAASHASIQPGPSPFGEIVFRGNVYVEYYIESQQQ